MGDLMRYRVTFSNEKYVEVVEETMTGAIETAVLLVDYGYVIKCEIVE